MSMFPPLESSSHLIHIILLLFLSVCVILAGERVRGAIRSYARLREGLGLTELRLTRDLNAQAIAVEPEAITHMLNQVTMDVTGEFPGIEEVVLIATSPAYVAAQGKDFTHYVFSPYDIKRNQQGNRLPRQVKKYVISPMLSNSFVIEQLEYVYHTLTTSRAADMMESPPALPRVPVWYLLVVPREIEIDF